MKNMVSLAVLCLLCLFAISSGAADLSDVKKHPSCSYCGMDRTKFAHSRVEIEYDDGSATGTCSLHCAAIDLAGNIDRTPVKILVGDYATREPLDAEKAFFVIGGGKPGVMTSNAKWAFAKEETAASFAKENGGTVVGFEEAMKAAYTDMYDDTRRIRDRRRMMKSQMKK